MPNTSAISPILPHFASAKSGQPSIESKASNNFNQILKNEFTNKVKKPPVNTTKQATNNQPVQAPPKPKNTMVNKGDMTPPEKTPLPADKAYDDSENANTIRTDETSTLLNFVGDLNAFARSGNLNSETSNSDLADAIDKSDTNGLLSLPPVEIKLASNLTPAELTSKTSGVGSSIDETIIKSTVSTSSTQLSEAAQLELGMTPAPASTYKNASEVEEANAKTTLTSNQALSDQSAGGLTGANSNQALVDTRKAANGQAKEIDGTVLDKHLDSNKNLTPTPLTDESKFKIETQTPGIASDGARVLSAKMAMPPSNDTANTNKVLSRDEKTDKTSAIASGERRTELNANERSANDKFSIDLKTQVQEARKENIEQSRKDQKEFTVVDIPKAAPPQSPPATLATTEVNSISQASNFIGPRVGSKAWDQAVGQKIIWMVAGGEQSAQLTLNPPDLGPVQVVLSISDNQVDASFISSHLDVREAIEAAAPKLREMMDNAGMSLTGFSVNSQSTPSGGTFSADGGSRNNSTNQRQSLTSDTDNSGTPIPTNTNKTSPLGLVDTFV
jgi:flagellar hook-length control protein FliK